MASGRDDRGNSSGPVLLKARTGIAGFDEVTLGGLPRGRSTLVTGGAGAGKTMFGVEFLVRGATEFDEPGVLIAFEETRDDLCANVASLGFDLPALERDGKLAIDALMLDPTEIIETGAFDLEGLFLRLDAAVTAVGAKRVVVDTVEVLFTAFHNESVVRAEMSRLIRWLKDRELTTVVTGERGREGQLTRFGIEEYVSDCVVVFDHRVIDEVSTRRMRVLKYRGSLHGTNEYPFFISDRGIVVAPITGMTLEAPATWERTSTGIPRLDHMLGGGVYRGSTVLVSGGAGTGKTTIAAHAADAACARGERVVFTSFEESPDQLVRNMASVGIDLQQWITAERLTIWATRPTASGLEEHLAGLHRMLDTNEPALMVLDAVGSLGAVGSANATTAMVSRYIDLLKSRGVTAVLTSSTPGGGDPESISVMVSSLVDTWLLLRNVECNGERNRLLFVIKSRGMAHSNQVREFILTDHGAELVDVYVGSDGVLFGSARVIQQAQEQASAADRQAEADRRRQALARRSLEVEAQIASLRLQLEMETADLERFLAAAAVGETMAAADRERLSRHRWADQKPDVVDVR